MLNSTLNIQVFFVIVQNYKTVKHLPELRSAE